MRNRRSFLGDQSVEYNLTAGIKDLMKEHPEIQLNMVEATNAAAFDQPVFAHGRVGCNHEPGRNPHRRPDSRP